MEHVHNYNSDSLYSVTSFSRNWKKQAIILSKIAYGNNQYLISGRDVINNNFWYDDNLIDIRRRIVLNTSPLFKSSNAETWSAMLNTGITNSTSDLEYFNSRFYISSNETYLLANATNYTTRPARILTTSNLDYWVSVGDRNDILVPNLFIPVAESPRQLMDYIATKFLDYNTAV